MAVVTLEQVVPDVLPVALDLEHRHVGRLQIGEVRGHGVDCVASPGVDLVHRRRVGIEVHKHEAAEDFDCDLAEAIVGEVEVGHAVGHAGTGERAIGGVRPCVVRAGDEPAHGSGAFEQRVPSVEAHIEEAAQRVVFAANDEDPFAADLRGQIVAGAMDLVGEADVEPAPLKDRDTFLLRNCR